MGLRDDITADISEALNTDMSDAVKPLTGVRKVQGEYDPSTGTTPAIELTYAGRGVFGGYKINEIDGSLIQASDTKLTVLQAEVTEPPAIGDLINGFRALDVGQDPASVTWTVQLRK